MKVGFLNKLIMLVSLCAVSSCISTDHHLDSVPIPGYSPPRYDRSGPDPIPLPNPSRTRVHRVIEQLNYSRQFSAKTFSNHDIKRSGGYGPEMVIVRSRRHNRPTYFLMGKNQVTQIEYEEFAIATGRSFRANKSLRNNSVTGVLLPDMFAYSTWLSLETGQEYRLPRAYEWFDVADYADSRRNFENEWGVEGIGDHLDEQVYLTEKRGSEYILSYNGGYDDGSVHIVKDVKPEDTISWFISRGLTTLVAWDSMILEAAGGSNTPFEFYTPPGKIYRRTFAPLHPEDPSKYEINRSGMTYYYLAGRNAAIDHEIRSGQTNRFSQEPTEDAAWVDRNRTTFRVVSPIDPTIDYFTATSWGAANVLNPNNQFKSTAYATTLEYYRKQKTVGYSFKERR